MTKPDPKRSDETREPSEILPEAHNEAIGPRTIETVSLVSLKRLADKMLPSSSHCLRSFDNF